MGKITGFLEIERKDKSYKPVKERIKTLVTDYGFDKNDA